MVVQHNLTAMNANRYLGINNSKLSKSLEKLSSGYAINRAGDNAAGLAVSEKMRSQIAGMTQGVKNAQDGISMVQTFEGALTETDSILQRMKTLADQMGNGSYDDPVDRAAAQQEFLQLNDELDQIADTDFNGVIVLNGGKMADGLKAVDGEFNYKNYVREPEQLNSSYVRVVDDQLVDDSDATNVHNMNKVWAGLNSNWNRTDIPKDNDGPDSVDVTVTYDATGGADKQTFWKVTSATGGADIANITVGNTKNGGFKLTAGGVDFANVVMDQNKLMNGDTVVLTLSNPSSAISAPTNIGAEELNSSLVEGVKADAIKDSDANLTTKIEAANVTDAKMTKAIDLIFKALDGATVTETLNADTAAVAGDGSLKIQLTDDDKSTFTEADADAHVVTLTVDGEKVQLAYKMDATKGTIEIGTVNAAGDDMDKKLVTLTASKIGDADSDTSGSKSWKVSLEHDSFDSSKSPSVTLKEPADNAVSKSNAFNKSEAIMTYKSDITLQVGARTKDAVNFTFKYQSDAIGDLKADLNCTAEGLGTSKLTIATQEDANYAIDKIDQAINKVSLVRGTFGAIQNRLEHKIDNMNVSIENLTSAESQIRDTNMPQEMMNFTKQQILAQASQSMLAQANQLPQSVLSLLQ